MLGIAFDGLLHLLAPLGIDSDLLASLGVQHLVAAGGDELRSALQQEGFLASLANGEEGAHPLSVGGEGLHHLLRVLHTDLHGVDVAGEHVLENGHVGGVSFLLVWIVGGVAAQDLLEEGSVLL